MKRQLGAVRAGGTLSRRSGREADARATAQLVADGHRAIGSVSVRHAISTEVCLRQVGAENPGLSMPLSRRGHRLRERPRQVRILSHRSHDPCAWRK